MGKNVIVVTPETISPFDRAFHYGDGCFSTMLVNASGQVCLLEEHLTRLQHDADALHLPSINFAEVEARILPLAKTSPSSVVKVLISRGQGGRGYSPSQCDEANVYLSVSTVPTHYPDLRKSGAVVGVSSVSLAEQPLLGGLKHVNRLEQVLIRRELDALQLDGINDVIVSSVSDHVVEMSAGNLFFFSDGEWHTPKVDSCGVNGVMRQFIMKQFAHTSRPVIEGRYDIEQISSSISLFMCNAIMGMCPIRELHMGTERFCFDTTPVTLIADSMHSAAHMDI